MMTHRLNILKQLIFSLSTLEVREKILLRQITKFHMVGVVHLNLSLVMAYAGIKYTINLRHYTGVGQELQMSTPVQFSFC
jgi:hypothetical protein